MTLEELYRFIGETVTIFTTSGGASGCGFTGVLLRVNPCFVTLCNRIGVAPTNPLSEEICGRRRDGRDGRDGRDEREWDEMHIIRVGSVCDIPLDRIAAFCHNAI